MINAIPDEPDEAGVDYGPEEESPATHAEAVRQKLERELSKVPGVTGTGIGRDANGEDTIIVYVREQSDTIGLPSSVDGVGVVVEVTGDITPIDTDTT